MKNIINAHPLKKYEKKAFRTLGIFLILIGAISLVNSFRITGFSILENLNTEARYFLGVMILIIGIVLLMTGRDKRGELELIAEEGIAVPSTTAERLDRISPKLKKTLVLDTSFLRAYTAQGIDALLNNLKGYEVIIVPPAVYKELGSKRFDDLKKVLTKYHLQKPIEGFESYREIAKDYIENTEKHLYNGQIIPIILGEKKPPKSRREAEPLIEETKKLIGYLNKKRLPLTKENLIRESERHYKASEADIEVLASALVEARDGKHDVVIGEKDRHLRDAIDQIKLRKDKKGKTKRIGRLLHYVEPYEHEI